MADTQGSAGVGAVMPKIDGIVPDAVETQMSGSAEDVHRPLLRNRHVTMLVLGSVGQVGQVSKGAGDNQREVRSQKVNVDTGFLIDDRVMEALPAHPSLRDLWAYALAASRQDEARYAGEAVGDLEDYLDARYVEETGGHRPEAELVDPGEEDDGET